MTAPAPRNHPAEVEDCSQCGAPDIEGHDCFTLDEMVRMGWTV